MNWKNFELMHGRILLKLPLVLENKDKEFNGKRVIFIDVDCDKEQAIADKYDVSGYPTIKLLKDGQVIEYDAKPSKETLNQFLNTVL